MLKLNQNNKQDANINNGQKESNNLKRDVDYELVKNLYHSVILSDDATVLVGLYENEKILYFKYRYC